MEKNLQWLERRKKLVPRGVGIFSQATAATARGATIVDADGTPLIDFAGGIGVMNVGHGQEAVVEAICAQAHKLIHSCFHVATYEPYLDLCEKLIALLPHGGETKAMLTNSGAESVENAIKIARQATGRPAVIAFNGAFHGRTMMGMSLTSRTSYKTGCGPFAPEVYRLPFPKLPPGADPTATGRENPHAAFVQSQLELLHEAFVTTVDPNQVAAIIIEPVQGEGGFHVAPFDYLKGLRQICDQHGILLTLDEVQTGFGRTGKWAAHHHTDIVPDLSTWAKSMGGGMPIGAVVGKAQIMDAAAPGTIGGTYLGNPVSCAAALATIRTMEEQGLNERAQEIGKITRDRFSCLRSRYPRHISDVRGLGAMIAFDLVKDGDPQRPNSELCQQLTVSCLNKGLILLSAGPHKNVIRILAPLAITNQELDRGLDIIELELSQLLG